MIDDKNIGHLMPLNIEDELKTSFISYAMAVIVSRALPDVRDGLKPVHRRILYSMQELGVTPDKPFRKSARIVGDVLGKYHPHGDSSVYDAMVRLAQDFATHYPLVDGQGNFGSVDGDGAAAMRYTEARLSKLSMEMVRDLEKETVDFYPNFDETLMQPNVLPSRFPNLLVNGSQGIAVGVFFGIAKFEWVFFGSGKADFIIFAVIEKHFQPLVDVKAQMMSAFGADIKGFLHLLREKHLSADGTFDP